MSAPSLFAPASGTARMLIGMIVVMTLAIVFLVGMIIGRLASPVAEPPPSGAIDFAAAPELTLTLPADVTVREVRAGDGRVTLEVVTAAGETQVFTAPTAGYRGPVRLRIATAP